MGMGLRNDRKGEIGMRGERTAGAGISLALAAMAGLMLAGCAHTPQSGAHVPPAAPVPARGEAIVYTTSPCFGHCPVYRVTVRADGTATFEGQRFTAVTGRRDFDVTPAQYAAFAAALAPFRPAEGEVRYVPGSPLCEQMATDMPGVTVEWVAADGARRLLDFYYGCDMEKRARMAQALGNAPDALPIEGMVGAQP